MEDALLASLESNPENRMAFEFLMVYYLCTYQPEKIVANLDRFDSFGYRKIPRHFQEAVVVDSLRRGDPLTDIDARVGREVVESAAEFAQIVANSQSRQEAAYVAALSGYGSTYFYYYNFGVSGL
jgi:hypothetical protein